MDKRLFDIKKKIDASSGEFFLHLDNILKDDVKKALNEVQYHTKVYLFSGLIRNFFLNVSEYRDIDIVLEKEVDIKAIFGDWKIEKNSFGGYKIFFDSGVMDLWFMKNTWAFQHSANTLSFQIEENIPNTAFFNFSSVVYCINRKEFHYTMHFLEFLKTKTIDFVERANANHGLCIVNTFYYSKKFNLRISSRLLTLLREFHNQSSIDYKYVQIKHFGKVLFTESEIEMNLLEPAKSSRPDPSLITT